MHISFCMNIETILNIVTLGQHNQNYELGFDLGSDALPRIVYSLNIEDEKYIGSLSVSAIMAACRIIFDVWLCAKQYAALGRACAHLKDGSAARFGVRGSRCTRVA